MKKILSWLLILCMICSLLPASVFTASASFTAGDCSRYTDGSVQWNFDSETGTLTISGKGYMFDYDSCASYYDPNLSVDPSKRPWEDFLDKIITVNIKSGVLSVGCRAFDGCDQLTQVILPAGMTNVGEESFNDCCSLTYIGIPKGVESIGIYAFSGCENLTTAVLSTGLTSISDDLFTECYNLTEVTIPATVEEIADTAFADCDKLSAIYFDGTSEQWNAIEKYGVTYDNIYFNSYFGTCGSSQNNLVWFYEPTSGVLTLDGIGRSSSRPWINSENIRHNVKKLCIRDGITGFNESDFENMDGLTEIEFPTNPFSLGKESFCGCDNLVTVTIPGNVTGMGGGSFEGCDRLTTVIIEEGVASISRTFQNCVSLATIHIPVSITTITDNAFNGCTALSNVHYAGTEEQWNAITVGSGNEALTNATVHFANVSSGSCGAEGDNLTWTFDSATGALTISGSGAMANFDGNAAPWNGCNVKSVSIGEGVTTIGKKAFYELPNLTEVVFPASLKSIGADAFNSNQNITNAQYNGSSDYWVFDLVCESPLNFYVIASDSHYVGFCGTGKRGLSWELTLNGEFSLSGGGYGGTQMVDYSLENLPPWFPIRDKIKSLYYPDHIGDGFSDYAFYDCYNLRSISEESVGSIGVSTFEGCTSLENLCYYYNSFLVKTIGERAFYGCTNLKIIQMSRYATTIGDNAFANCDNLDAVCYFGDGDPWSVISVGENNEALTTSAVFYDFYAGRINGTCGDNLTWTFDANNGIFSVRGEGAMPSSGPWVSFRGLIKSVTIGEGITLVRGFDGSKKEYTVLSKVSLPSTVTEIGDFAFYQCDALKEINFPDGLITINEGAFDGCAALENVVFPDTLVKLGKDSFNYCPSLTSITIPGSVTNVMPSPFWGCKNLETVTIEEGVPEISINMFSECAALSTIYIPVSVTEINQCAFDCTALSDVYYAGSEAQWNAIVIEEDRNEPLLNATIHFAETDEENPYSGTCGAEGDNLTWTFDPSNGALSISGTGAMANFEANGTPWDNYAVKSLTIGANVTSIGAYAFYGASNLTKVNGAYDILSIGESAFEGCSGLSEKSLTYDLESIGKNAFKGSGLTSISIPDRLVTYVGEGAFADCKSLISAEIGINVTYLAEGLFDGCSSLTSVKIPVSVKYIEDSAFSGCDVLSEVYYRGSEEMWKKLPVGIENEALENATITFAREETIVSGICGENLVWRLDLETGILFILGEGEMTQSPWSSFYDAVKIAYIDDGISSLMRYSFEDFYCLSTIYFPASIQKFGGDATFGCDRLTTVYYGGDAGQWDAIDKSDKGGNWRLERYAEIHCDTPYGTCCVEDIVIWRLNPESGELTVTGRGEMVGEDWYEFEDQIKTVNISSGVTKVGGFGKYQYPNISKVVLPDTVTEIKDFAFDRCSALKEINLPEGLISIGECAFQSCDSLTEIILPNSLQYLGKDAFYCCDGLISVVIPGSVTEFGGSGQFYGCTALENVTIQEGITSINLSMFTDCTSLSTVYLPISLKVIADDAFMGCSSLSDVYYAGSIAQWNQITVRMNNEALENATIHFGAACTHESTTDTVVDATCLTTGSVTTICDDCGETVKVTAIPIGDHSYDGVVTEPTCTEDGYTTFTCSVCGDSYVGDVVPRPGHIYTPDKTVDPTCEVPGRTIYHCTVCGDVITILIPNPGHTFESVVTEPTCTEDGYTTNTCSVCGHIEITDEVPALGHSYDKVVTAPTCTEEGYTTCTCTVCSFVEVVDVVPALGHSYDKVVTAPTCTEEGYTTCTCSVCSFVEIVDKVPATGHVYDEIITEPTCTEDGYTTYLCSVCGDTYTDGVVTHPGHSYESVVTAPTCTEEGYTTNTCTVCGEISIVDMVPATGHVDTTTVTEDATCLDDGLITVTCNTCGEVVSEEVIPAPGHDYETVVTAPTCTEDGYTTYTCSVCGDTYTADVTPAKGHRYNIEVTVAPGCEQPGEHTYTCTVCGDKFAVVVAPTGHALSYTNNGDNHTIVCDNNCGYSVEEAHSFVDGACICGALEVAPPTQVNIKIGHALALDSDLGVKYRVKYSDIGAAVPNYVTAGAYLVIEKDVYPSGAEKTVETYVLAADLTSDPARMVFDMKGIQAAEMGSELRAVLHVFDAEGREYISNVDVYSIVDYVEQYLTNFSYESSSKFVTMLIDMLNYGAAAQVNFGRRTDELVNAGFEAYQQYATKELAAELTDVKETISNDRSITAVTKMGFSINLADRTEINAKMTMAEGYTMEDISKVEVRNADGEVVDTITEFKLLVDDNNRVQVTFSGVKSVNMRDMFYFVVYVGDQIASDTYGYSIEASAKTTIASSTGSSADMILACMYYGDSAAAYFGK